MLDKLFGGTTEALSLSLGGLSRRQKALAENVANADTPHYKRVDVSFEPQLKKALASQREPYELAVTQPGHLAIGPYSLSDVRPEILRAEDDTMRNDGNNVDIELEMTRLAQNSITYTAVAQMLQRKFSGLKDVIRGA